MSEYNTTGDYSLLQCKLISKKGMVTDLRVMFTNITFYESIFSNCINGDISIEDTHNLVSKLDITGNELLQLEFQTNGKPETRQLTFFVYKLSDRVKVSDKLQKYTLHFISVEQFTAQQVKISQYYEGTINEIVKNVYDNYVSGKDLYIEETTGIHKLIIPALNGFESINWLSKRAISKELNESGFLFFENKDGYNFVSIEKLYSNDTNVVYKHEPSNVFADSNNKAKEKFNNVRKYTINEPKDTLSKIDQGIVSSTMLSFNMKNRELNLLEDKNPNNVGLLWNVQPSSKLFSKVMFDSEDLSSQSILQHNRTLNNINHASITIEINGDSDLTVGWTCLFKIPSPNTNDGEQEYETQYETQKKLIGELKHSFDRNTYTVYATLYQKGF